jgi:DNA polymerase IV (DinB-like DNA polymerase)
MPRIVAHLDMDAFFAAIEERDNPRLQGLPLVVGADPCKGQGRGVVSTANYPARTYGIHSATPIARAWRLSEAARREGKPPVVFLSVDMKKYRDVSDRVMALLRRTVPIVEPASIDEAYLDLSDARSFSDAERICLEIKETIRARERLTASIGIGPNKLIAKIASGMRKPDGLTLVAEAHAEAFLEPLPVRSIPGIGPKTESALVRDGVRTVRDLKRFSRTELQARFGRHGLTLYEEIRGRDDSPVSEAYEVKSIGEQETFGEDTLDSRLLTERLAEMCRHVFLRFDAHGFLAFRTVVLTVRFSDFETTSRSHTLASPAADLRTLEIEALKQLLPFLDRRENPDRKLIRLLGVRLEKLSRTEDHATWLPFT